MDSVFASLTGLVLIDPGMLLLGLAVPVALLLARRRGRPSLPFAPTGLLLGRTPRPSLTKAEPSEAPVARSLRTRLAFLPRALSVLGLLLSIVALARPVLREPKPRTTEGIEIALALDVSSSMVAKDLDPTLTRLEVAKRAATAFVKARSDDRIALVSFARFPDLRCPTTHDHRALGEILDRVSPVEKNGPEDATGIGTAVALAAEALSAAAATSRVVVLLSDGEENVATAGTSREIAPMHAAQLCKDLGIRVHAIAVGKGTETAKGEVVPLDPAELRRLAEKTGGRFFVAADARTLAEVYAAIDELERTPMEEPEFEIVERYLPFLLLGLACLVASRLLAGAGLGVLP